MKFLIKYLFLILPSFFVLDFFAQDNLQVQAQLTAKTIKIGEQTQLIFRARLLDGTSSIIQFPKINDSLAPHVEMVSSTNIDTFFPEKNNPKLLGKQQILTITSFDSGFHVIPPFKFYLNNDTSKAYETEALLLEVQTVRIDTNTASIKDIKLPFEEKYNWRDDIPFYASVAGVVVFLILLFFVVKRLLRKKPVEVVKPKLSEPAHLYALRVLNEAKQQKIYEQGQTKVYYSTISDTLRLYIEERCAVPALECTTEETIASLSSSDLIPDHIAQLKQILVTADLVKFAKMEPMAYEHELNVDKAIAFVNQTFVIKPIISEKQNDPDSPDSYRDRDSAVTENTKQA